MKRYLAIDLGASSGRHLVGYQGAEGIILEEVHRFKTGMDVGPGGLVWNIPRLLDEIKLGIKKAFAKYPGIVSLSVDTWGVDYVLLDGDNDILPYYAYRNSRCEEAAKKVHKTLPFSELYARTGIQFAPFNTIYQLYDDLQKGRLEKATDYLMLPCYFSYRLTGVKCHEYTNESTGALLDLKTGTYANDLLNRLGLPPRLFGEIHQPGHVIGRLCEEVAKEVGGNCDVVLCASHDTASAFEAIDLPEDAALLSSGTWSLLGIKSQVPIATPLSMKANYTNEGGVGYYRFLKNIMGMYLPNRLQEELGWSLPQILEEAEKSTYDKTFDVFDPSLTAPTYMTGAVVDLLGERPSNGDLFASVYRSLALGYAKAIQELESITGRGYRSIVIVGGGAKNRFLNRLIEEATHKSTIAMPIEATALGNIMIQIKGEE